MAQKKKPWHTLSRTAKFYRKNKRARLKKRQTDKRINSRPSQIKKRVEANRGRRIAKRRGINVKNKDYDHKAGKMVNYKLNRGRLGEGGRGRKRKK